MPGWLSHWLSEWLTRLLPDRFIDWLTDWLVGRFPSACCFPGWLFGLKNVEVWSLWVLLDFFFNPNSLPSHYLTGSVGLFLTTFQALLLTGSPTPWLLAWVACLSNAWQNRHFLDWLNGWVKGQWVVAWKIRTKPSALSSPLLANIQQNSTKAVWVAHLWPLILVLYWPTGWPTSLE